MIVPASSSLALLILLAILMTVSWAILRKLIVTDPPRIKALKVFLKNTGHASFSAWNKAGMSSGSA